jgi:hypothetical protein
MILPGAGRPPESSHEAQILACKSQANDPVAASIRKNTGGKYVDRWRHAI